MICSLLDDLCAMLMAFESKSQGEAELVYRRTSFSLQDRAQNPSVKLRLG